MKKSCIKVDDNLTDFGKFVLLISVKIHITVTKMETIEGF